MKITEIAAVLHEKFGTSEPWDNDGVMLELGNDIKKIAVCLDATSETADKAHEIGADAIITHHPLIFKPLSRLVDDSTSKRVIKCIQNGISVASFHTCFDIYSGGVNDTLCTKLHIKNAVPFLPYGRIGSVTEQSFAEFCDFASSVLKCVPFQTVDSGKRVSRVAVVSGGGKDEVFDAFKAGADTYLTGEASHAAMIDAKEYGINLLCCGHFETENIAVPTLAAIIKDCFPNIEVIEIGT